MLHYAPLHQWRHAAALERRRGATSSSLRWRCVPRRIAANIAKLPGLVKKDRRNE